MAKKNSFKERKEEHINNNQEPQINMLDMFLESLGDDNVAHAKGLVEKSVQSIVNRRAYFRRKNIEDGAFRRAQKEVPEDVLENTDFLDCIKWFAQEYPLKSLANSDVFTTHEMWNMEHRIIELAGQKDDVYIQPRDAVERAIAKKVGISDEQKEAVYACSIQSNRVTVIEGKAGAGKSYTMKAVKDLYTSQDYHVMGTALGWAAAKVLGKSAELADENCRAIEGLTREWVEARKNGVEPFPGPTLLIVDEAGMVGTKHMATILEETARSKYPVKVVLTGDSKQVVPVAAGAALELIITFHGTTVIKTIRRQKQASHRRAVANFCHKNSGFAINTFVNQECFNWCKDNDMVLNMITQHYLSYRLHHPDKEALILSLENKTVLEINHRVRLAYKKLGLISSKDVELLVTDGERSFESRFSVGDEVLIRANDKNLLVYEIDENKSPIRPDTWKPISQGVFNRNSGRIVAIKKSKDPVGSYDFTVDLDGEDPSRVVLNSEKFKGYSSRGMPMVHNYATTIYGSQGQTVSQVFLLDSPRMDFRLSYVGMSRHTEKVDVYLNETELHNRLDQTVGRRQSLENRLKMDKSKKSIQDARVELGRYSRKEMLQSVSLRWGKHSDNLTAIMYERLRQHARKNTKDEEIAAMVRPENNVDRVVDFIPQINKPYPLIDVQRVFNLPDPVEETNLLDIDTVEANKQKHEPSEMPVDVDATPMPMPSKYSYKNRHHGAMLPTKEETFIGRALSSLFGQKTDKTPNVDSNHPQKYTRQTSITSPFDDVDGLGPENDETSADMLKILNKYLKPLRPKSLPYVKEKQSCGMVVYPEEDKELEKKLIEDDLPDPRPHYINFDGVPQVANVQGGPDDEWIASQRGKLWDVGKNGEPRIVAKNHKGLTSRYRLDGECVVGYGFPPVYLNQYGSEKSPVYIVSGAKEWLWLCQTIEEKYKETPQNIPHIIWAAKDMDWKFLVSSLKMSEKIVVVRSKVDHRQIPWAVDLQKLLDKKYGLKSFVSPQITEQELYNGIKTISSKKDENPPQAVVAECGDDAPPKASVPGRFRR